MSIITTIGLCKKRMPAAGWELFCEHSRADTLDPFDPETCHDDDEIMLSRVQAQQYEADAHIQKSA